MKKSLLSAAVLALGLALPGLAHADIKIAVNGPMTGEYATFGKQFQDGAAMAIEDINKAGGVMGQKLEVQYGDDACDPKQAVAIANKVAGDKVAFVAGHFCSGSSIPASAVYAEENIIQISPASTNPKLTDERKGPNVFRVCGRDDQQGSVAGAYLAKNFKDKNVAIVHDKQAYSKGLADETKKAMNAAGKKEVMYETITPKEKDYTALVSKLKAAKVDVLYYGGYHTEAGLIVRQMRDQGMKTVLVGGDALVTKEYADITGAAGDGTLMTFSPDPRKNPAAKEIVARFKAKGVEPEGYVLYTYAAIQAWKQAVEKAGGLDPKTVIAALNSSEFDTVIGKFKFDKKGDPNLPPYAFYKWSKGTYDQIN
ncbi:MAG: branched-chain amino acid ABC transporter substrate-binding protein [Pseudomonadota bacterium]|nr:branched-chain amino acid ABC transporter substrate-binding protein [Pseudomonadota bacterium]